jgi:hypothetical protein
VAGISGTTILKKLNEFNCIVLSFFQAETVQKALSVGLL